MKRLDFDDLYEKVDGHWIWRGSKCKPGKSPCFRGVSAARYALELMGGSVEAGRIFKRICQQDGCINPNHHQGGVTSVEGLKCRVCGTVKAKSRNGCPHGSLAGQPWSSR